MGTTEKQNSLVHQFFSKGEDFEEVSAKAVQRVEDWINFFPEKSLIIHVLMIYFLNILIFCKSVRIDIVI